MKHKKSLAVIAVLMCCILIILPISCTAIYFGSAASARLKDTVRETVDFYLSQVSERTGSTLNAMRNSIYYLMSDDATQQIMRTEVAPDQLKRLEVEEGLSRALLVSDTLDPNAVTGIYLVKDGQQYLSILRGGEFIGTSRRVMHVFETYKNANSARELFTVPEYPDYCYCIVDYIDLETMKTLGKIIIEIRAANLVDTSYIDTVYQQANVVVSRTDGGIISGAETPFASALKGKIKGDLKGHYIDIDGASYYHTGQFLPPSRVRIDVFIPRNEILETIRQTLFVYGLFTVLILLITLLIGGFLFYMLGKPVKQMLNKIDLLATGDLSVRMEPTPYRETERMATAFNDMADRLEDLFGEVYTKGLLLREAEFNLLESQIQPHFIFNVLELINMRCLAANELGICRIVSNLAQLLRTNVTYKHKQTITFQEELLYVRYYLELQKERFEEKLNYEINLEDSSILHYYLPKLTIQPLVENGIVHGLERKRGGGTLKISIWEEDESVCVKVSDDGVGFDTSRIDLEAESDDGQTRHNHVALANINRRIHLLYGQQYGMTISSEPGKGTDVMLTLPIDTDNQSERSFYDVQNYDRG
ncbi:sensor histidine kinase [Sinanaerobacter chloroacetimidivorans]|uniref:Sensor histidine kinase n=1 Tax=Sinanaerobacter chloroacetimidivorans TaxID=2818044 RepID=A0A8J8B4F7_9FIRM|nr:sensor histidine kinase [Sinanaerobacter chloroacetimidivorans]MBR0599305.1 sensor histidine kinase [Sinanaerobacter chloroacetimidivorans]